MKFGQTCPRPLSHCGSSSALPEKTLRRECYSQRLETASAYFGPRYFMLHFHSTLTAVAGQFRRRVPSIRPKSLSDLWLAKTLTKARLSYVKRGQSSSSWLTVIGSPGWLFELTNSEVSARPHYADYASHTRIFDARPTGARSRTPTAKKRNALQQRRLRMKPCVPRKSWTPWTRTWPRCESLSPPPLAPAPNPAQTKRLSQNSGPQATRPRFGSNAASYDTGSKTGSPVTDRRAFVFAPRIAGFPPSFAMTVFGAVGRASPLGRPKRLESGQKARDSRDSPG